MTGFSKMEQTDIDEKCRYRQYRISTSSVQTHVHEKRNAKFVYNGLFPIILVVLVFWRGYWWLSQHNPWLSSISIFEGTLETQAKSILKKYPLIDGHNDLLILLRGHYSNHISTSNFTTAFELGGLPGHVDLPRLKKGHLGGAFWSAFIPCPANNSDFSDEAYTPIVRATLQQLDAYRQLHDLYPSIFTPPSTASAAEAAWKKHGRLISPIGIEGLHQIGNSPATMRLYHALGARYVTLTWNCHNQYADAAVTRNPDTGKFGPSTPVWGGINPTKGRNLIYEMNRLGMLVDLSHVSRDTMIDALVGDGAPHSSWKGSVAPPIFSHSSAYTVCPHPRNVQDDVLQLVKKRNSLVMINFSADFVSCRAADDPKELPIYVPENATLAHVVRHIRHIGELIGYEHVGIGSDFDGIETAPRGLEDVSKFPDLVAELLRQGVSKANVINIIGGNLLRVWKEADAIADMLKLVRPPLDDDIPPRTV